MEKGLAAFIWLLGFVMQVAPQEVVSNLSLWLEVFGITAPAWIAPPYVDTVATVTLWILAGVLFYSGLKSKQPTKPIPTKTRYHIAIGCFIAAIVACVLLVMKIQEQNELFAEIRRDRELAFKLEHNPEFAEELRVKLNNRQSQ